MIWLFAVSLAALVGLLVSSEWRHTESTRLLVEAISGERAEYIALVDRLCQRLQAPEQAVVEHAVRTAEPPAMPEVAFTDEQHWLANGMSKEQLAELADRIELAG